MMKEGDFVKIDYVGTIKESGVVFEATNEEEAKKRGVYNDQVKYGPLPVIIGAGFLIKGLESAVKEMKVGDKKKITVKPEDAFGQRSQKMIKMFPEAEFTKRDVVPYQGLPINIKNMMGRVQSVSGGRVKVDFNHPLAGKELIYELEVKEKITKKEDKIKSVTRFYYPAVVNQKIKIDSKLVEIMADNLAQMNPRTKAIISETIFKWIDGIDTVRFSEEFNKPKK